MAIRSRLAVPVLAGALLMVGVTGCGSSADEATEPKASDGASETAASSASPSESTAADESPAQEQSSEAADAEPVVITIKDFKFTGPKTVAPGATIEVVNEDRSSHTLTSETEDFEEVVLKGGAEGTFTAPTKPGSYDYVCVYHPEMTGTLVVE